MYMTTTLSLSIYIYINVKTDLFLKINITTEQLLKYYATFKMRKFESLFYKINTCLHNTLAMDCRQSKYSQ